MVSSNFAKTGSGKYQRMREVNPFAQLDWSWMTGRAAYGCVIPKKENEVLVMLKLAFPVTAEVMLVVNGNFILGDGGKYHYMCISIYVCSLFNML